MTKSAFACICNAERLIASGKATFWTFTFDTRFSEGDVGLDHDWGADQWDNCLRAMRRERPDLAGLRVFESHKNGRLHVHVIFNQRVPIRWVKAMASRFGFGRINCKPIQGGKNGLPDYLAKYIGKGCGTRRQLRKGRRLWATFGKLPEKTLVKNIVVDSPEARFFRWWFKASLQEARVFYATVISSLSCRFDEVLPSCAVPKLETHGQRWHWGRRLYHASRIWRACCRSASPRRFHGAFA